ncbi:hypothetical protein GHK78_33825 [Sinorhizobium meliloti]|nr:hypothetical protein [Sinorhizobium meliloti]RVN96516.1 hypothetical protein CN105_04790 [Sinorhizobium meliloti]
MHGLSRGCWRSVLVRSHNVSSGTNKGLRGTGTGNVIFVEAKTRTLVSLRRSLQRGNGVFANFWIRLVQIEAPADHCAAATGVTSSGRSDSLAQPRQSRPCRPGQLDRGSGFAARGVTLVGP